jgi:hypothetical protein
MRIKLMSLLLGTALALPTLSYTVGCDRELALDETTTSGPNGTTHMETTVKEKPDGTIQKTQEKSVDHNSPPPP